MEPDSEIDKFFKDLPTEDKTLADIFGTEPPLEKKPDEVLPEKEPRKNHAHRRLEKQLQDEREEKFRLQALIQARTEVEGAKSTAEVDPLLTQMYGENTDAIRLHSELLHKYATKAREEAIQEFEQMLSKQAQQEEVFGSQIDEGLETLEDKYGIDLTSDSDTAVRDRTAFLKLVSKLAPKDEEGNLKDYPDFVETYEMFKGLKEKNDNARAKQIASRTMQKPAGNSDATPPQRTPGFRGWQRDMRTT